MPVTSAKGTAASGVSTCAAGQRAGRRTRPQRAASRHSACPQTLAGALCRPRRRRTPPRPPLPRGSAAFRWLLATRSSSTGRAPWSAAHPAYRRSRPSAATFAWLRPGRRAPSPRLGSPRKAPARRVRRRALLCSSAVSCRQRRPASRKASSGGERVNRRQRPRRRGSVHAVGRGGAAGAGARGGAGADGAAERAHLSGPAGGAAGQCLSARAAAHRPRGAAGAARRRQRVAPRRESRAEAAPAGGARRSRNVKTRHLRNAVARLPVALRSIALRSMRRPEAA
mmetsp:Transcript_30989/g.101471  ORF Transcript_30989/g.101471 Transcript_30989/m.101471 type:complete len:283 (+) Transcript_30989:158-1006(+)